MTSINELLPFVFLSHLGGDEGKAYLSINRAIFLSHLGGDEG